MRRRTAALTAWIARAARVKSPTLPPGVAVTGIIAAYAGWLWLLIAAPVLVSSVLTVAIAAAWCRWLEEHSPDGGSEPVHASSRRQAAMALRAARRPALAMHPPRRAGLPLRLTASSSRRTRLARASLLTVAACLLAPVSAAGQSAPAPSSPSSRDPWRSVTFGATFEGYYQYNWNRPPDRILVLRAYDTRGNTFSIQQVALVVDAAPDIEAGRRYGLRADLQFGQAADTVQGSPANEPRPDVYRHVWQAYGTYVFPVGARGLQADFGKFASILGYETNYAKDNQAFSRAYLFNFLPFYHSGLRLSLPVTDKVSLLYMLTNGIQQTEEFNDFKSNHLAAIVKPVPAVTWTVNYYFGREQADNGEPGGPDGYFRVFDAYVTAAPTPALTLGFDANHVTSELRQNDPSVSLQGTGAYARYQLTGASALGVRYERLDDEGLFGGIDQVIHEATLTAEHRLADGFIVRAEFRRDWSSASFFPGRLGATDLRRHQNTALIGGIWVIGNKTGTW